MSTTDTYIPVPLHKAPSGKVTKWGVAHEGETLKALSWRSKADVLAWIEEAKATGEIPAEDLQAAAMVAEREALRESVRQAKASTVLAFDEATGETVAIPKAPKARAPKEPKRVITHVLVDPKGDVRSKCTSLEAATRRAKKLSKRFGVELTVKEV